MVAISLIWKHRTSNEKLKEAKGKFFVPPDSKCSSYPPINNLQRGTSVDVCRHLAVTLRSLRRYPNLFLAYQHIFSQSTECISNYCSILPCKYFKTCKSIIHNNLCLFFTRRKPIILFNQRVGFGKTLPA